MSLEDLGNIGEFVAAVAVLVSLIYLALQIRQNTRAVRRSAYQSAAEIFAGTNSLLVQDPEIARIVNTGYSHPETLDENDLVRFERYVGMHHMNMENLFFQHRDGIIEKERWKAYEAVLREVVVTPGVSTYWERCRHRYSASYQAFIERLRSS